MAMEGLSTEWCGVYELLHTDFTNDLDEKLKGQGEMLLKSMTKFLEVNTGKLDGLITTRVDGIHEEMAFDLEQIHVEMSKENQGRVDASPDLTQNWEWTR